MPTPTAHVHVSPAEKLSAIVDVYTYAAPPYRLPSDLPFEVVDFPEDPEPEALPFPAVPAGPLSWDEVPIGGEALAYWNPGDFKPDHRSTVAKLEDGAMRRTVNGRYEHSDGPRTGEAYEVHSPAAIGERSAAAARAESIARWRRRADFARQALSVAEAMHALAPIARLTFSAANVADVSFETGEELRLSVDAYAGTGRMKCAVVTPDDLLADARALRFYPPNVAVSTAARDRFAKAIGGQFVRSLLRTAKAYREELSSRAAAAAERDRITEETEATIRELTPGLPAGVALSNVYGERRVKVRFTREVDASAAAAFLDALDAALPAAD